MRRRNRYPRKWLTAKLESLDERLRQIEGHLRPAPKPPIYRRVWTWVVAGLVAVVGSSLFVLPNELSLGYFFKMRGFQEDLTYFASLAPSHCDLARPELAKLQVRVRRDSLEYAWIQRSLALCRDAQSIDQEGIEAETSLLDARAKYEEALRILDDPRSPSSVGAFFGVRHPYSSEEHTEVALRLAEVQRRLAFFGQAKPRLLEARATLERALGLSPTERWEAIAWNNLGNVLNHMYVASPPNKYEPHFEPLPEPDHLALLKEAARAYWRAAALTEETSPTGRLIKTNLAIQHLLIASAEAPSFLFLEDSGEVPVPTVASATLAAMAFRLFRQVEAEESLTARGLAQPNFGLGLGFACLTLIDETGNHYRKILLGSPAKDNPGDKIANALHLADELYRSLGMFNSYGLTYAPDHYREVIAHYEDLQQVPVEYVHSLAHLGSSLVEMGIAFHGEHHFTEGMAALERVLAVPDAKNQTRRIDRVFGIIRYASSGDRPGGRNEALTTLAIYNLWRAALFRAAFVDRKRMLELANILSSEISGDWFPDSQGPIAWLDRSLAYQGGAMTLAIVSADGGRTSLGSRFYAKQAQEAYSRQRPQPQPQQVEWRTFVLRRF